MTKKWCQHITWRKNIKSWFMEVSSVQTGMIFYMPIMDAYKYCPICGTAKPEEMAK